MTSLGTPVPPQRDFILHPNVSNVHQYPNRFTVLSYNMLAEIYATRQMYPYCPLWALRWKYRKHLILRQLKEWNADIVCLQEVQADHHIEDLEKALHKRGYMGIYKQKTRQGASGRVDGCAIYFKTDRYVGC